MPNGNDVIFMTRSFWDEMSIPKSIVQNSYNKFLGHENCLIDSRAQAIDWLTQILSVLKEELIQWLKKTDSNQVIKDLYLILDKCFRFHMAQKEARKQLVVLNITHEDILNVFSENRNIALTVINSVNLWLENSLIFQHSIDNIPLDDSSNINVDLLIKLYLYGLVSKNISLLAMSKKFGVHELFYGISVNLQNNEPIEAIRYHPVIYFNPALTGNQDVFDVKVQDYKNVDTLPFGRGFQDLHQISFLMSLRTMSTFQAELLNNGKYAHVVIDKEHFLSLVTKYTSGIVDSKNFFDAFVLTKENVSSQLQKGDDIIWKMGVNKYRHEIRPFVCLENNMVAISYAALDQAKNLWLSYFANGGMIYSNYKDQLTEAIFDRNEELSKQLVKIIRNKLRCHYTASVDEIDVRYDRIFGTKEYDYGDYDLIFYTPETKELFLIEAKFFSDSLNNSGIINDYEKLFRENGYYTHCRNRCDLAMSEIDKLKEFLGVSEKITTHFLFISSKPLEIEFTDDDGIVSFPCLSIFDSYIKGDLISEDGSKTIRPTHIL